MVANHFDQFDKEQVSEAEARNFAKENNAIFIGVSSNGIGIDELFQIIGKKILNPNWNQKHGNKDEDKYKKKKRYRKNDDCALF